MGTDTFVTTMLRDTAREFLDARLKIQPGQDEAQPEVGELDRTLWAEIADMGWLGVTLNEDDGGAGLSLGDEMLLFEEFGRVLYPGPFWSNVALALPCLERAPDARLRLLDGSSSITLAWAEPGGLEHLSDAAQATCQAVLADGAWTVSGRKVDVPDLASADEVIVLTCTSEGPALHLVAADGRGVTIHAGSAMDDSRRFGSISLDRAPAQLLAIAADAEKLIAQLRLRALLAIAYESLGLAERMLADTVAYASAREQFGRAIGGFQALSVPMADRYVDIQLARALAGWAVVAVETGSASARAAAEIAKASCSRAAEATGETATQVFGAIAFTWEHHVHRYLRRALANAQFEGAPALQRRRIADALVDEQAVPQTVELMDDDAAAVFRVEVRDWIAANLPTSESGNGLLSDPAQFEEVKRAWQQRMASTGHLVAHWPEAYGGRAAPPLTTAIFRGEAVRAHPRVSHGDGGEDLVAPLLIQHGTPEQKQRFLDPIRQETEIWAQGFSEPDAGSDLAALKTRAVARGDAWVLNGNKTWTTYAPYADFLFILARTDAQAKRHRGITCFIVDARAPGIEIRPIRDIAGTDEFGEVFLSDVEVPTANILGRVNEGWAVAVMTLAFERVIESCEDISELEFMFDRLLDGLRERRERHGPDAVPESTREHVGELWSALQAVKLVQHSSLRALEASETPPPESEILKLAWSEVSQQVARLGLELFGVRHHDDQPSGVRRFWETSYLNSRSMTIYAGTSEILRSVIAERILGLPRSR